MSHAPEDVTSMLIQWSEGDRSALDRLIPVVYEELHQIAERCFRLERLDNTLQATALVNEAYIRLVNQSGVSWQNRAQFFGIAATTMRRILVERARARNASKRGSGDYKLDLTEASDVPVDSSRLVFWRWTTRSMNLSRSTRSRAESSKRSSSAGLRSKRRQK